MTTQSVTIEETIAAGITAWVDLTGVDPTNTTHYQIGNIDVHNSYRDLQARYTTLKPNGDNPHD